VSDTEGIIEAPDQIIITLTSRKPWKIHIGGVIESPNLGMAMLQEALRELETEWRIARGIAAQQKVKQQNDENARVISILNKASRGN
jgi:hypothetical protein